MEQILTPEFVRTALLLMLGGTLTLFGGAFSIFDRRKKDRDDRYTSGVERLMDALIAESETSCKVSRIVVEYSGRAVQKFPDTVFDIQTLAKLRALQGLYAWEQNAAYKELIDSRKAWMKCINDIIATGEPTLPKHKNDYKSAANGYHAALENFRVTVCEAFQTRKLT